MLDADGTSWPNGGWWAYCHNYVDPQPYYDRCISDYCKNQTPETLCDVYDAYTQVCLAAQPYSGAYDR